MRQRGVFAACVLLSAALCITADAERLTTPQASSPPPRSASPRLTSRVATPSVVSVTDTVSAAVASVEPKRLTTPAKAAPPPLRTVAVRFERRTDVATRRRALAAEGLRIVHDIPAISWASIEPINPDESADDALRRLRRVSQIKTAEKDVRVFPAATPTDQSFGEQWGFANTGQAGGTPDADARLTPAWDWSRGDGTVIAVVDSGVDFSHPDLVGKQHPASWDFLHGDATVFDPDDGDKHGTHVAGTAAAVSNNGIGGAGTAWNANIMALKFLHPWTGGAASTGAAAIVHAVDNGADVINCSWGSGTYASAVADAVAYAASKGILVICAAGNSGVNVDTTPFYPASLPATNIVSVAAVNRTDALSTFSNYSATGVDLAAPGDEIYSTQPQFSAAALIDPGTYRIAYLAFPAESVMGSTTRNQVITRALATVATNTASPILLVDDSWPTIAGETVEPYRRVTKYTSALTAAGYTNVSTWSVQTSGTPALATLTGKVVIWFTGAATIRYTEYRTPGAYTLTSTERTLFQNFFNGGGRMLISSGDLGYDMEWIGGTAATFYRNYFHTTLGDDDPWSNYLSGTSSGFLSGMNLELYDYVRYSDGYDDIEPLDAASSETAIWPQYATISGTSMASPHVAGTVALMLARIPSLTAEQTKSSLLQTVVPIASLTGKTLTGGRLDAAAAVGSLSTPASLSVGPAGTGAQSVYWTNPDDADFSATRVLRRTGTEPTGPDDGAATVVYEGSGTSAQSGGLTAGETVHYALWARNALGSWSPPARLSTTVVDPIGEGVPIPPGTDVSVSLNGVTATFPSVTSPGWLSVTRTAPRHAPPPNFRWLSNGYYDIHAVGDFAMPVELTLQYDTSQATGSGGMVRLFHREGAAWQDITSQVDSETGTMIASTSSFSDFGLGAPVSESDPVPASAGDSLLDGFALVAALVAALVGRNRLRAP